MLKRLRDEMSESMIESADPIPSYLIECLAWNAQDVSLMQPTYLDAMRGVLADTFNGMLTDDGCAEWGEVNELKYLFRTAQPRTRQAAHQFLSDAWDYVGVWDE